MLLECSNAGHKEKRDEEEDSSNQFYVIYGDG